MAIMATGHAGPHKAELERFSLVVEKTIAAAMALTLLTIAVYALGFPSEVVRHPWALGAHASPQPLGFGWSLAVFGVFLVAASPVFYALNAARRLFHGFARRSVFTQEAAGEFRSLAFGLFVASCMPTLGTIGLTAVLSAAGSAHAVAVSFSLDQLLFAVFGLIMLGVARVMREAAVMADDYARIV
jgi:hypothetical protein